MRGLRGDKVKPAKFGSPRPIAAAAVPVRLRERSEMEKIRQRAATSQAWQMESWRVYNVLGEVNFAFNLIANAFSRIRFHAAVAVNPDEPPVEVADGSMIEVGEGKQVGAKGGVDPRLGARAREFMAKLQQGHGMATLQRSYALNRQVSGECYLCCIQGDWSVKSTSELLVDPGGQMRLQTSVTTTSATPTYLDDKTSSVYRMWTMHPQYSADPDCNLRSVLYLCEQLIKLNRMINNTVASRMNAGILQVANEIADGMRTPGAEPNLNGDPNAPVEIHPFDADLNATMTQPIQDDQAGAAVIPMVVRNAYQYMDGIKWTSLARDVDQHMLTYAENVLGRILNGINIPKDAITGFQNVRYANAQQITQDTYEQGVEPLALAFADELTKIYLKPMLRADADASGWDAAEVEKMVVWYDPSEVVTRPDRGADADAGMDRGALSADAWRRAHGFSADDAPDELEDLKRLLIHGQPLPPNLIDFLARKVLPEYFEGAPPLVTQAQAGMSQDEAATTQLRRTPGAVAKMGQQPLRAVPADTTQHPAGSDDQDEPPGGRLPPQVGTR